MATADRAFINAEQRAFDWLKVKLADIDGGVSGYLGELPITLGPQNFSVTERQMWSFAIVSQPETMHSNVGSPVHCHTAQATFRAMLTKRETAMLFAGRLRTVLPDEVAAGLVQRLAIMDGLSIGRDTVELKSDQDEGGLIRVWIIEQPMLIQFSNDDEIIGYEGN